MAFSRGYENLFCKGYHTFHISGDEISIITTRHQNDGDPDQMLRSAAKWHLNLQ